MGLAALLRRNAQTRADHPAFVFGARRTSWGALLDRARRLAAVFSDQGVRPGDRIALLMATSDRYFEAIHAAVWAGAIAVPMNIRLTPAELVDNLADSAPALLVCEPALRGLADAMLAGSQRSVPLVEIGQTQPDARWQDGDRLMAVATPREDADRRGDDPFAIFYTGGTTGRSKGVVLTHRNFISCGLTTIAEGFVREDAIYLNMMPTFHVSSMWPATTALVSGATTICQSEFTPEGVLTAIELHRVTDMLLVPTMIQMMIDHPDFARFDTSSLARIIYGAAPITEALLARAIEAFPHSRLTQGYGMTELSPLTTMLHAPFHARHELRRSAGRAVMGVEVRVVDGEGAELPPGEQGEIVVRGDNVMHEYWQRPQETAEALRGGWMHTGDAGYIDAEGFLFISDRIKDMIISGGENIYSIEVENALAQHPAVQQCAVIGLPDARWGERVHAIVNLHLNAKASADELIDFAKSRIAPYKCPRSVTIRDTPLPLSNVGKVMKRQLREEYGS